ncbi:hypothetical protein SRABI26_01087 [Arthrobacter sp. Bi26]|uniref:hypothetical protein n=1 Tax=Arthrobacter sp. Bi26 TaxID=2822350 RepID=UPI001D634633|nr:hypothetical protein [Arthrobacter sp. Bi26]CAH0166643.1 hypothetical protein SRABI26_01087 [Arthrobacter sp. Bi26]
MGMLIGIVIFLMLWLGVFLACIILPIVALARYNRRRSQPLAAEPEWPPLRAKYAPPPVVGLESKVRPTRQQIEAAPVVEPKWNGTYRWCVGQDKKAWDRDFKEAEQLAEARLTPPGQGSTF